MTGFYSDATASHFWVFYRGTISCIVLEHLLGSCALLLVLTHEDVDYWLYCCYLWDIGFSQLSLRQKMGEVGVNNLNLTIYYTKGDSQSGLDKLEESNSGLRWVFWETISNQYAKQYLSSILTDESGCDLNNIHIGS